MHTSTDNNLNNPMRTGDIPLLPTQDPIKCPPVYHYNDFEFQAMKHNLDPHAIYVVTDSIGRRYIYTGDHGSIEYQPPIKRECLIRVNNDNSCEIVLYDHEDNFLTPLCRYCDIETASRMIKQLQGDLATIGMSIWTELDSFIHETISRPEFIMFIIMAYNPAYKSHPHVRRILDLIENNPKLSSNAMLNNMVHVIPELSPIYRLYQKLDNIIVKHGEIDIRKYTTLELRLLVLELEKVLKVYG